MRRFWDWYERHYTLNVAFAAALFLLQIVHLVWLTAEPLWSKLLGEPLFVAERPYSWPLYLVDYTEIPALLSVSLIYVNELRTRRSWKPVLLLVFLNSQWLHILWLTDEFVVRTSDGAQSTLPGWLAYVAISIDYLELPVMIDTLRRVGAALQERGLGVVRPERAERTPG